MKITKQFHRHGIEIKIDSMRTYRTQSWMFISRGVGKHVMELSEGNKKPIHYGETSSSTGEPKENNIYIYIYPSFSSSSSTLPLKTKVEGYTLRAEGC